MELDREHHKSCPNSCSDFAFGFDDPAFSDRTLKLLIFDDTLDETNTKDCKLNGLLRSLRQKKEEIPESPKKYKVKSVNICSLILAAKSSFFYKLFTNGMKESNHHEVTLRIHSSDETAFMDVLRFMYNKNLLSANTPNTLIEALLAADKYDVPLCVNYCCTLLLSFPMTAELAFCYIDLPSTITITKDAIQPLLNAAEDFLPSVLKDISEYLEDIMNLSLDGIKLILSSDDLKVGSEDIVYDILVEWTKEQFHDSEERCRVLKSQMFDLIRFKYVTRQKLKSIVHEFSDYNHLDPIVVSTLMEAILNDCKPNLSKHRRSFALLPVEVISFEIPNRHCVVYLDLKREECEDIELVTSQSFTLDENVFYLEVECLNHDTEGYTFALFLALEKCRVQSIKVKYEYAVRKKSSPETFVRLRDRICHIFEEGNNLSMGYYDLFDATWDDIMAEDSQFFINGTLHLRIEISLVD